MSFLVKQYIDGEPEVNTRKVLEWRANLAVRLLQEMDGWESERKRVIEEYEDDAEPEYAEALRDKVWKELRINLNAMLKVLRGGSEAVSQVDQEACQRAVLYERQRIVDLLMSQHEAAKGSHNYWQVAAKLIQADTNLRSLR